MEAPGKGRATTKASTTQGPFNLPKDQCQLTDALKFKRDVCALMRGKMMQLYRATASKPSICCGAKAMMPNMTTGASGATRSPRPHKCGSMANKASALAKHFHFVKEKRAVGLVVLKYLATALQVADMFTKQILSLIHI